MDTLRRETKGQSEKNDVLAEVNKGHRGTETLCDFLGLVKKMDD